MPEILIRHLHKIYIGVLLLCSLSVYTIGIGHPNALFWDENYHIASAQKYIDGVMYMEPHPPLGKLLIAGSEAALKLNSDKDKSQFNRTDYITDTHMPEGGIQYTGFRLPSALLMGLSVLFFYGTVRRITANKHLAFAFSFFLIFDNALVIHARAAMLEGIQLFFVLAAIYQMTRAITDKYQYQAEIRLKHYVYLGLWIGLAVSVKINGAVLLLLFVMLYGADQWESLRNRQWWPLLRRLTTSAPCGVMPLVAIVLSIFYLHVGLGGEIAAHKTYKAGSQYQQSLAENGSWSLSTFLAAMPDNGRYMSEYADGVPRLDICKEGENGSYALGWPLGTKTINYRWSKQTTDGTTYVRYHNILANPVIWFSVVAGLILSAGLIISRYIYQNPVKDTALFYWIVAFNTLYLGYMVAILQIDRVMYLYHYLVPLTFGIINLALVFQYVFLEQLARGSRHTYTNLACYVLLAFGVFALFSPFTYSWELTETQFAARNWFGFWKLELVR
ncbi:phospholipid carrier-dependent glycosyltransferase [Gilvimarinus sp. SDUM040013]|uniref:Polyprenol-phosphate-mannose--protein mannosyltransferase n=1 Tax=Gilvimarinus gilvus TaxID=3058038 RepID=A0ABU4RVW4_9GAMM|nr:phospholipid carrier-dependent glycosyltransferase [Gilvimarinus sp. SDUM040013]MDO3388298.1 phospholipid carrier-dependent glycosyltransferase [Gilvimarinus sp. SDUM040013]MDX6847848.1 phospholipid carrier-dependent glycosyltransferase [Gilvimarinus sp. SDUM040013]